MEIKIIAHIETDFAGKFGLPRQSGMIESIAGRIVFEPEYRNAEALRGLEGFDYIWLLWDFSQAHRDEWRPTVRPPRLGGNRRVGVFATRSPYRPNSIGLSCVRMLGIDMAAHDGPVIMVGGADLMNGTPIYDIKPYLAYTDSHPLARGGFTQGEAHAQGELLDVVISSELQERLGAKKAATLKEVLAADPRPRYQSDDNRAYGMCFSGQEVKFVVKDALLTAFHADEEK